MDIEKFLSQIKELGGTIAYDDLKISIIEVSLPDTRITDNNLMASCTIPLIYNDTCKFLAVRKASPLGETLLCRLCQLAARRIYHPDGDPALSSRSVAFRQ
jgi:hypothetical protein